MTKDRFCQDGAPVQNKMLFSYSVLFYRMRHLVTPLSDFSSFQYPVLFFNAELTSITYYVNESLEYNIYPKYLHRHA